MAVLIRSRKAVRPRPEKTILDPWGEETEYYVLPPSGTLRGWSSPFHYQQSASLDKSPDTAAGQPAARRGRPLREALGLLAGAAIPDPGFVEDMEAVLADVGSAPEDPWARS
jgi:hypothetical protein